jgi:mannose-6-phosphate isomerase-like protein (cupin superfamily)
MIVRKNDYVEEIRKNMRDGDGEVSILRLMPDEYKHEKCRLFAKITLKKGCSIGFHTHTGEAETYYIISGRGKAYDDQGIEIILDPGDGMYTGFGAGHSIKNTEEEELIFIALILLD